MAPTMQFDESANGHQIEKKVKDELEISLLEARTAGYRWVMKTAGEPVCQMLEDKVQPSPAVGGTGRHVWQFRAIAAGDGEIELEYLRPWEKSAEPARTFLLKVRVRP
jgi:inhibitor of cysteine peptidase